MLFGDGGTSRRLLSDRALLDLLLSACGARLGPVRTGFCWAGDLDELRARGADPSMCRSSRGWLEHAVAVAAGCPARPARQTRWTASTSRTTT